jgi:protein TonB
MDRARRLTPSRNLVVASGVVALHAAALWALQSGLIRQTVELVVPVAMLSEFVSPPAPQPAPVPVPVPAPAPQQAVVRKAVTPPAPRPVAQPAPTPSPQPITAAPEPAPPTVVAAAPVVAATPAPAPAPEPPKLQLPSSDADYLQNPKPVYPPISKRLGEQGKVVLRVLIGADGNAQDAQVRNSSGYERLDQAALQTVLKWRYVPGRRAGVAEAMWFNVPIHFVLE